MSHISPESIRELKSALHKQLQNSDLTSKIEQAVVNGQFGQDLSTEELRFRLQESGIIEEMFEVLDWKKTTKPPSQSKQEKKPFSIPKNESRENILHNHRYILMRVAGGRAFLDQLTADEFDSTFCISVSFLGQRFNSESVLGTVEPNFDEAFLLDMQPNSTSGVRILDSKSLLSLNDRIHLVVVKRSTRGDSCALGSASIDWRSVLACPSSSESFSIELSSDESGVPAGVLNITLEIIPRLHETLSVDVVNIQIDLEKSRNGEKSRRLLIYTRRWWQDFLAIRANHSARFVKIFGQDETGISRLVCCFVTPLASRLIESASYAARFVSLIPFETKKGPDSSNSDRWRSLHSILSGHCGSLGSHSLLLASLFLGLGLRAWVCIGRRGQGEPHYWVLTLALDGRATFWEPLTGHVFPHEPHTPPQHPYRSVGCVFNHNSFYANCQATDSVTICDFNLNDSTKWKSMDSEVITNISWPNCPLLVANTIEIDSLEKRLENDLSNILSDWRRSRKLSTFWDHRLSHLLTPALSGYELERLYGIPIPGDHFQQAVRAYVPDGETFKAFPLQLNHMCAQRAFSACMKLSACEEIIACRGDSVRFAVRVKVFKYPEQALAVWLMFSCKYRAIP